jgi:hypothetical protein
LSKGVSNVAPKGRFGKVFACVFCLILTVFMTVQVAHVHADAAMDSSHCQICSAAHIAVDAKPAWLTPFVLELIRMVSLGEPATGSRAVLVTAFIRPPPASL